jgi:DNA polymerase I-like protein with 3'-5' exonuclease and polymerase domains
MFVDDPEWAAPTEFPELHGTIGLDTETCDLLLKTHGPSWPFDKGGFIAGVSIAMENGWKGYYPVAHAGGGNLDRNIVFGWLREQLAKPDLTIVSHNRIYDEGWMNKEGIKVAGTYQCTMSAMALLDENRLSYSLDNVGYDLCKLRKDEKLLRQAAKDFGVDPKKDMWKLPAGFVGDYAEADAWNCLQIWLKQRDMLDEAKLNGIMALEMDLIPCLLAMRRQGVRVDMDKAEIAVARMLAQEKTSLAEIKRISGIDIDMWAAESIARAFDKRGVAYEKTDKGAPSFRAQWLAACSDPIGKLIVKARQANKARTTFLEGHILGHAVNGRIHGQFNALKGDNEGGGVRGAVTGRFSSDTPNLQNLPARDEEIGPMVRDLFLPEEGERWTAIDFSSQEPRLTVHYSALTKQKGIQETVDAYHANPEHDFYQAGVEGTGLKRKLVKGIVLGRSYGMGGAKLCHDHGLPTKWIENASGRKIEVAGDEGQAMLDAVDAAMPYVKGLYDEVEKRAKRRGYITTILGRRRLFSTDSSPSNRGAFTYKALNCLIQGSAADMTKKAMVDAFKAGIIPLVTVHDELGLSCGSDASIQRAKDIMESAVPLVIPMRTDVEVGPSWGTAKTWVKAL